MTAKRYTDELTDTHRACLAWIPREVRVLEFGCAGGPLTRALRDELGCRVTGFELSAEAAARAQPFSERMIVGDIEDPRPWNRLAPPYDVAVFADVIEHLRNPAEALERTRMVLTPNGLLIVAVPNVAHWSIRLELLRGRFEYTEYGILDSTHLRFFTRATLQTLVLASGFRIEEVKPAFVPFRGDRLSRRLHLWPLKTRLNALLASAFPEAIAFKWCIRCRP